MDHVAESWGAFAGHHVVSTEGPDLVITRAGANVIVVARPHDEVAESTALHAVRGSWLEVPPSGGPARLVCGSMEGIVLRVRLTSGDSMDVTYEDPDASSEDQV